MRGGAAEALEAALPPRTRAKPRPPSAPPSPSALAEQHDIGTTVMMPYADRLGAFGLWFRQLWAESLGKDGKGTTPIRAIGTVDQHSQLQLYLDGPADKMFTLVMLARSGQRRCCRARARRRQGSRLSRRQRMGDLLDAEQRATAATLIRNGRPTRSHPVSPRLDERASARC